MRSTSHEEPWEFGRRTWTFEGNYICSWETMYGGRGRPRRIWACSPPPRTWNVRVLLHPLQLLLRRRLRHVVLAEALEQLVLVE
eukprot:gene8826-biopygen16667